MDMLKTRQAICDYADAYWPTIQRWIAQEGFPAVKLGENQWRSSKRAIDAWWEEKLTKSATP